MNENFQDELKKAKQQDDFRNSTERIATILKATAYAPLEDREDYENAIKQISLQLNMLRIVERKLAEGLYPLTFIRD